jgi:hypothetical protein
MIVPLALRTYESDVEFLVKIRDRDIKAVDFVGIAVVIGHLVDGRLQDLGAFFLSVLGKTAEKVKDAVGCETDVYRHLSVLYGQDAESVAGFVDMEHAAVGLEESLVLSVFKRTIWNRLRFGLGRGFRNGILSRLGRRHIGRSGRRSGRRLCRASRRKSGDQ